METRPLWHKKQMFIHGWLSYYIDPKAPPEFTWHKKRDAVCVCVGKWATILQLCITRKGINTRSFQCCKLLTSVMCLHGSAHSGYGTHRCKNWRHEALWLMQIGCKTQHWKLVDRLVLHCRYQQVREVFTATYPLWLCKQSVSAAIKYALLVNHFRSKIFEKYMDLLRNVYIFQAF